MPPRKRLNPKKKSSVSQTPLRSISVKSKLHPIHATGAVPPTFPTPYPIVHLTATPLHSTEILTIPHFFTAAECNFWISHAQSLRFSSITHPATAEIAFRNHSRVELSDQYAAAAIFRRLSPLLSPIVTGSKTPPVGCNPRLRLYRYQVGDRFGRHIDDTDVLESRLITRATVLIYLNGGEHDDLEGGETKFYGQRGALVASVAPHQGLAVVHAHGDLCLLHEAAVVTKGVKFVLRTDVTYALE